MLLSKQQSTAWLRLQEACSNMVLGIWWACGQWCSEDIYDLEKFALMSSMFAEDNPGGEDNPGDDDENTEECPADAPEGKDAPACEDPDCSGGENRICETGEWKGCRCLVSSTSIQHAGNLMDWRATHLALQFLLCPTNLEWYCHDQEMTLEANDFQTLVDAFCKDVNLETSAEKKLTAKDVGLAGYDDTVFSFTWTMRDATCSSYCAELYSAFLQSNECGSDSHHRSVTGLQDFSCGVATYSFYEPEPEGPPAPFEEGKCFITAELYDNFNAPSNTSPFSMSIKRVTDSRGNDLQPTWANSAGRCEAAYPCWTGSLLQDRFFMRPIEGQSIYVHFDIGNNGDEGHVSWRSDDKMEHGKVPSL